MAAATDAVSIGALNRMLAGSARARFVENGVAKAAWVSGRMGRGPVATVVGIGLAPTPT
jgi:hypothetical protein